MPPLRDELHTRVADEIRSRLRADLDPDQLAEIALDAVGRGCEWLLSRAESYQDRAHVAERELVRRNLASALKRRWLPWT